MDVDEVKPIVDLDSDDEEEVQTERRDGPVDVDEYLDLPSDEMGQDDDDDRFIVYEDDFIVRGEEDYDKIMMGYCEGFEPEVIDLSPCHMSSSSSSSSLLLSYQKRRKFSAEVIPQPIAEQVSRPSRGKKMSKPLNEEDEDTDDEEDEEEEDIVHDAGAESFCANCKGRDCRGGKFCI